MYSKASLYISMYLQTVVLLIISTPFIITPPTGYGTAIVT